MATSTKSTLNNILQSVLSIVNEDQSAVYPPSVFSDHFNFTTSALLSKLVKEYPDNPLAIDILDPYIKFDMIAVKNGFFTMPNDYRNILGAPYVFVNQNEDGQCQKLPQITTLQQFQVAQQKGACKCLPITIVSESEFSVRTSSTYKYPKHTSPIGYFTGQRMVKICPYDLTKAFVLYAMQEPVFRFGYFLQPDDTYIWDPSTTVESIWPTAAFDILVRAIVALFSAYVRDPGLTNFSIVLKEQGII